MICFGYSLFRQLIIEQTRRFLRFYIKKKEVFHLLSLFNLQEDIKYFFQSIFFDKYFFVTQIELDM